MMPCSGTEEWKTAGKSVVYLLVETTNGSKYHGTGFLINKGNDYSSSDNPYILTAGHNLCLGGSQSDYTNISIFVNYEDHYCGDIKQRGGVFAGNLSIKEYGTSSLITPSDPLYRASQDFSLLQNSRDVEYLASKNIEYAGWYLNHDFFSVGYAWSSKG